MYPLLGIECMQLSDEVCSSLVGVSSHGFKPSSTFIPYIEYRARHPAENVPECTMYI